MKIIALEEHFMTPALRDACAGDPFARALRLITEHAPSPSGRDLLAQLLDLGEGRIADMDAAGIDVQVLSHTVPGPEAVPAKTAARLSAEANDAVAEAVAAHPGRFAGFATLPVSDPQGAARELSRAVTDLRFVGTMINGHVDGRYLDDEFFWPVFEAAESLGVPVYLHPHRPPQPVVDTSYSGFSPVVSEMLATGAWGWHVETGLHALRLILGGVFDRFPKLQIILGHMGEALPSMIWRTNRTMTGITGLAKPVADYFADNFYVTTSGVFDHAPFSAAVHALGIDRMLFSVDYPYAVNTEARAFLDHLPLSPRDREKVAHVNAEGLLRLGK
jgi:predicted TIM-barrel fold metal-dependent hydrolase